MTLRRIPGVEMTLKPFLFQRLLLSLLAAAIALLGLRCRGGAHDEALAIVDGEVVHAQAFRARYGKLLKMTSMRDNLLARVKVLDGLILEEVLLQEAEMRGLTTGRSYLRQVEAIEQQALLNAYAREMAKQRVRITDRDVRRAFVRLKTRVRARHLYAATLDEANRLYTRLREGESFEWLAEQTFNDPTLQTSGGDLGYFTLGDMDPAFEEAAFTLPVGEISAPIKTAYGYSIIQVLDRIREPFMTEYDYQRKKKRIRAYLEWLETRKQLKSLAQETAAALKIEFSDAGLRAVMALISRPADSLRESTRQRDVAIARSQQLEMPLLQYRDGAWSVADFFAHAEFTSDRQKQRVKTGEQLRQFITGLLVRERFLEQARRARLSQQDGVRQEIERETRNFTLARIRELIDREVRAQIEIPEDSLRVHYDTFAGCYFYPAEVNVAEILVASEKTARELAARLQQGEDFHTLARKYTLREWARDRGGELGFAPRGRFGFLADTIFSAPVGSLIGPVAMDSMYSVMKVLAKRPKRLKSFAEAKPEIERQLFWKWYRDAMQAYFRDLRQKRKIEKFEDRMRELAVVPASS